MIGFKNFFYENSPNDTSTVNLGKPNIRQRDDVDSNLQFDKNDDIADYHNMTREEQSRYLARLSTPQIISLMWRSAKVGRPIFNQGSSTVK